MGILLNKGDKMKTYLCAMILCLMFTGALFCEDTQMTQKVTIQGKDMHFSAILMALSKQHGLNFVLPENLDRKVTLNFHNVSINAALKSISRSLGLNIRKLGSVYYISKLQYPAPPVAKKIPDMFEAFCPMKKFKMGGCSGNCAEKFRAGKCPKNAGEASASGCGKKCGSGNCCKKPGEPASCGSRKQGSKRIEKRIIMKDCLKSGSGDREIMYTSTPMTEYVTINVKNFDVKKLFLMIEKISGRKIAVNPRVSGLVDYNVKGKYFKEAVTEIADLVNARVIDGETVLTVIK